MAITQKPNSTSPAPGAGAIAEKEAKDPNAEQNTETTETGSEEQSETEKTIAGELIVAEQPEWVQMILDSNQAVVDSNLAVIEGIKSFVEKAGEVVSDIIAEAKGETKAAKAPIQKVEVNPEARYVVAQGQSFQDKHNPEQVYKAGDDVTGFEAERLENLLSQGIIEEA